jgi:hypothetical protein
MLLTHRKLLQSKAIAIENDLRATLRKRFEARINELVENLSDLAAPVEPLLVVRRVLREQIVILHRPLLARSSSRFPILRSTRSTLSRSHSTLICAEPFLEGGVCLLRDQPIGDSSLHRACAQIQREFWHPPDLSRAAGTNKYRS